MQWKGRYSELRKIRAFPIFPSQVSVACGSWLLCDHTHMFQSQFLHPPPTAIGNAYAVLSNPDKRQQYDQYGDLSAQPGAAQQQGRSRPGFHRSFHRDFEADISPEELFNIFFGGRFPTGGGYRVFTPASATSTNQSSRVVTIVGGKKMRFFSIIAVSHSRKHPRVHQPGGLLLSVLPASSSTRL